MVAAASLLLVLVSVRQQPSFLAKDTMRKPSVTMLVEHTVPAPKDHPELHSLGVKLPTNVKLGSENFIFEGPRGGRVAVRVDAEGSSARSLTRKALAEFEQSFKKKKGRLDTSSFVAKPWFGTVKGPNTVGDRHVDSYTAMRVDGSLVIKIDASWPPRNAKAEQEATELARYVIWTAATVAN